MDILGFVAFVITIIVIGITIMGVTYIKYDYVRLEEENEKLRTDLHNARKRKMEKDNKKIVKEDK